MLDRGEIERQLQGKSREHCAAFAVRSAMRVLPLLAALNGANGGAFLFWSEEDRAKHLLAVHWAYSCSIQYVLNNGSVFAAAYATRGDTACAAAYAAVAEDVAIIQEIYSDLASMNHVPAATLLTHRFWLAPEKAIEPILPSRAWNMT